MWVQLCRPAVCNSHGLKKPSQPGCLGVSASSPDLFSPLDLVDLGPLDFHGPKIVNYPSGVWGFRCLLYFPGRQVLCEVETCTCLFLSGVQLFWPWVVPQKEGVESQEGKLGEMAGAWAQALVMINNNSCEISLISCRMFFLGITEPP